VTDIAAMRHCDKAVAALAAAMSDVTNGMVAQLRLIETALGLTASSLTDPVAIVATDVPQDNRTPLVQVYDESWVWVGPHREKVMNVNCTVLVSYASDSDVAAADTIMRRYMVAVAQVIELDSTLGGYVVGAALTDGDSSRSIGDTSSTRHARAQGVLVQVHSP
jgi:hypothetical protein